jgi:hypothetical protein
MSVFISTVTAGDNTIATFVFTELEDCCDIATSITVVWRRPHSDDAVIEHLFKSFHYKLMGSCSKRQVVGVIEFFNYIGAKEPIHRFRLDLTRGDQKFLLPWGLLVSGLKGGSCREPSSGDKPLCMHSTAPPGSPTLPLQDPDASMPGVHSSIVTIPSHH